MWDSATEPSTKENKDIYLWASQMNTLPSEDYCED